MKPFALVILLVASTYGMNPYGNVRVSYGMEQPSSNPISYSKMPDPYNPPAVAPAPAYQAPAYQAPAPVYKAPAPVYQAPAPVYQAPAPVYQAPAPTYQAPAPAYQAPAPAYGGYGSSAPQAAPIAITRYNAVYNEDSSASHDYATAHGINHQESTNVRMNPGARGTPEDPMAGSAMLTKTGSFSYQSPEGRTISLNYVADENGFRATGDHLPTPPPIPAEILKSLAVIRAAGAASSYGYAAPAPAPAYGGYSAPAPAPAAPAYGGYSAPAPMPSAPARAQY